MMSLINANFYDDQILNSYEDPTEELNFIKKSEMFALNHLIANCSADTPEGASLVDIGTCTGRYLRWAVTAGFSNIFGIDHSPAAVEFCNHLKELQDKSEILLGDCSNSKIWHDLNSIDVFLIMMGTFNHLNTKQISNMIQHISAAAATDAQLYISIWRHTPEGLDLYRDSDISGLTIYTIEDVQKMLEKNWNLSRIELTPSLFVMQFSN